jgi:hypothetical protein
MSLLHSPKIVTNGLVLCLDAASRKSYPGTGNVWRDLSGNGNDGTLTNGPIFSSANGGSIVLDGTNDYITIPNSSILRPSTELTVSMWVKANSFTSEWNRLLGQDYSVSFGGYLIFLETGGKLIRALHYANGTEKRCNTNIELSLITFKNIVFTFKMGDAIRSFFDGVASTTVSLNAGTFAYNTNPLYISNTTSGGNWFNGQISNTSIYNRALTPEEIQQNFNATRGRYGI